MLQKSVSKKPSAHAPWEVALMEAMEKSVIGQMKHI